MRPGHQRSRGLVRDRQPAPLRRRRSSPGSTRTPATSPAASTRPPASRSGSSRSPSSRRPRRSPRSSARPTPSPTCVGVVAWMHTFSPAKMWIGGLTDLRKPLVHLHTQYNRDLPVVRDRHGLHEPEPGRPRRPRVRVHPDPAAARPQDDRRPLGGPGGLRAAGRVGAGGGRLARGAPAEGRPLRRQHARGRGHRGRQGRGPGAARVLRQRLRRQRAGGAGRGRRRRGVDELVDAYDDAYDVAAPLRRGGDRHAELRTAARIEAGLRSLHERRRLRRVHGHVRGPRRARAAARDRRPAADGRRLRLRRGRRLEGRGPRPDPQGRWPTGCRAARRSWRTTPTTSAIPVPEVLGAHMLEVCPSIARRPAVVRDPPALDRRQVRPGPARLRRRARARRHPRPRRPRATGSG